MHPAKGRISEFSADSNTLHKHGACQALQHWCRLLRLQWKLQMYWSLAIGGMNLLIMMWLPWIWNLSHEQEIARLPCPLPNPATKRCLAWNSLHKLHDNSASLRADLSHFRQRHNMIRMFTSCINYQMVTSSRLKGLLWSPQASNTTAKPLQNTFQVCRLQSQCAKDVLSQILWQSECAT